MIKGLFSSLTPHWATPKALYKQLDEEFHFTDDPCPLHGSGGLIRSWGKRTYVNPPYGRKITPWIQKGLEESQKGKVIVFLLPSRTDTKWFQDLILPNAKDIRFIRGRLRFNDIKRPAPFPSMIVIF